MIRHVATIGSAVEKRVEREAEAEAEAEAAITNTRTGTRTDAIVTSATLDDGKKSNSKVDEKKSTGMEQAILNTFGNVTEVKKEEEEGSTLSDNQGSALTAETTKPEKKRWWSRSRS